MLKKYHQMECLDGLLDNPNELDELAKDILQYRLYSFPLNSQQRKSARQKIYDSLVEKHGKDLASSISKALSPFWNHENNSILTESFYHQFYSSISSANPFDINLSKNLPNEFLATLQEVFDLNHDEAIKNSVNNFFTNDTLSEHKKNYEKSKLRKNLLLFAFFTFAINYYLGLSILDINGIFSFIKHLVTILLFQLIFTVFASPDKMLDDLRKSKEIYDSLEDGPKKRELARRLEELKNFEMQLIKYDEGSKLFSYAIPILKTFFFITLAYIVYHIVCAVAERKTMNYSPYHLINKDYFSDLILENKNDLINLLNRLKDESDLQSQSTLQRNSRNKKVSTEIKIVEEGHYNPSLWETREEGNKQNSTKSKKRYHDPDYTAKKENSVDKITTVSGNRHQVFWPGISEKPCNISEPRYSFPANERLLDTLELIPCLYFELKPNIYVEINPQHFMDAISDLRLCYRFLSLAMSKPLYVGPKNKSGYIKLSKNECKQFDSSHGREPHSKLKLTTKNERVLLYQIDCSENDEICLGDPKLSSGVNVGHRS